MQIREQTINDRDAVYGVNVLAFDSPAEGDLVNALLDHAHPIVSLVADVDGVIFGHIMFSPVTLDAYSDLPMMGLAPMSVLPDHQRRGIGSALVQAGLEQCRQCGVVAVVVLGHPDFYPRFGFVPSSRFGIDSEYDVPEEVFMVMELQPNALSGKTGRAKYHAAFGEL